MDETNEKMNNIVISKEDGGLFGGYINEYVSTKEVGGNLIKTPYDFKVNILPKLLFSKEKLNNYSDRIIYAVQDMREYLKDEIKRKHPNGLLELMNRGDGVELIQTITEGPMMDTIQKEKVLANLLQEIEWTKGQAIEYPIAGEVEVDWREEGGPYKVTTVDYTRYRSAHLVKCRQYGGMVEITREYLRDCKWDIIGINMERLGRAMVRFMDARIEDTLKQTAWALFDNSMASVKAHTTGIGPSGTPNGSLSYLDVVSMYATLTAHGFRPTHILISPIVWPLWLQDQFLKGFGTFMYNRLQNIPALPQDVDLSDPQNIVKQAFPNMPQVVLSEEIPVDMHNGKYDIYMLDANELGGLYVAEDDQIPADQWTNVEKEVTYIKARAEKMPIIYHRGRAICKATNIAMAPSYPPILTVKTV